MKRTDRNLDIAKALKRSARQEYGLTPTHIATSQKAYSRARMKAQTRSFTMEY